MSVDDVPTCRLRAMLRQDLQKAVVSHYNYFVIAQPSAVHS